MVDFLPVTKLGLIPSPSHLPVASSTTLPRCSWSSSPLFNGNQQPLVQQSSNSISASCLASVPLYAEDQILAGTSQPSYLIVCGSVTDSSSTCEFSRIGRPRIVKFKLNRTLGQDSHCWIEFWPFPELFCLSSVAVHSATSLAAAQITPGPLMHMCCGSIPFKWSLPSVIM